MEQEIHITLRFNLATGKGGLNEIVYKLKQHRATPGHPRARYLVTNHGLKDVRIRADKGG